MSLPDLVQAKKTQRDKDWPMIRRLVEAHYFENRDKPNAAQIRFWLRELRTAALLVEATRIHTKFVRTLVSKRQLLAEAALGNVSAVEQALRNEEAAERERDRVYWLPLRKELE